MIFERRVGDDVRIVAEVRHPLSKELMVLGPYVLEATLSDGYNGMTNTPLTINKLGGAENVGRFEVLITSEQTRIFPNTYDIYITYTNDMGKRESIITQQLKLVGV